jgi:hypothetical protein
MDADELANEAAASVAAYFVALESGELDEAAAVASGAAGNRKLIEWVRVQLARAEEISAIQRLQRAPKDRDLRDLLAVHLRIRLKESPLHRMRLAHLLTGDDENTPG